MSAFINSGLFYGRVLSKSTKGNPFRNLSYNENFDNDWDYGVVYGAGIGLKIGKGKLIVEGRYRKSFNKFRVITAGSSPESISLTTSLKNKGWGLNLAYAIPFGVNSH